MEEKEKQQQENQDMVQWNDVKENSGKATTAIIILLLVIVIALGGFIFLKKDVLFNTKADNKEVEKNTTKEVKEEAVTFTDKELQEYVNYISPTSIGPSAKLYNVDKVVASELSARDKIEYIGNFVYSKSTTSDDYAYNILTESDVKSLVEEVYGPNSYERTTFNLGCGDYIFRENEGKYYSKTGCGGATATSAYNIITNYKATKEKLEIETAYVFLHNTKTIYKDFSLKEEIGEYTGEDIPNTVDTYEKRNKVITEFLTNFIKENEDKVNHMVYTYESKDGTHYYFKSFTNNK